MTNLKSLLLAFAAVILLFVFSFACGLIVGDRGRVIDFGLVEVRAYTPDDPANADWETATGKLVLYSDYSVAVSRDVEEFVNGISNNKGMYIPGYNKKTEYSIINDRSNLPIRSIEILITAPRGHDTTAIIQRQTRARKWGVKKGTLKALDTPAGRICWVEFSMNEDKP